MNHYDRFDLSCGAPISSGFYGTRIVHAWAPTIIYAKHFRTIIRQNQKGIGMGWENVITTSVENENKINSWRFIVNSQPAATHSGVYAYVIITPPVGFQWTSVDILRAMDAVHTTSALLRRQCSDASSRHRRSSLLARWTGIARVISAVRQTASTETKTIHNVRVRAHRIRL